MTSKIHPIVFCPLCKEWARWNPSTLLLLNHSRHLSKKKKKGCPLGGKSIVHFYYNKLYSTKKILEAYFWTKTGADHVEQWLADINECVESIRYYIESDEL